MRRLALGLSRNFADWSLKAKLICAGLLALVLTLGAQTFIYTSRVAAFMHGELDTHARQLQPVLTAALAAPLVQRDYATLQQILVEVQRRDGLVYLVVLDPAGMVIASAGWQAGDPLPPVRSGKHSVGADGVPRHDYGHPIEYAGQPLGELRYGVSAAALDATNRAVFGIGLSVAGAAALFFALMLIGLGVLLTRPLERLTRASQSIRAGHYDIKLPLGGRDEVGVLAENFHHMASEVKERIRALTERETQLALAKEQAESANSAKSQFLAKVSHEVRTPLNGVLGMLQTMQGGDLTAEQREQLRIAYASGLSLLGVLNGILDFSRAESGVMTVEAVPFAPMREIEQVVGLFRTLAAEKGLALISDVRLGGIERVVGDPTRVRQVLSNLIANAIKFTERGAVTVRAECMAIDEQRVNLCITVSDTGIGIDAGQLDRIFEPFVQGDDSITRRYGGTGLGLAIARQLSRAMGGDVQARSVPAQGSTFTLSLPLVLAPRSVTTEPAVARTWRQFGLHLLVVEDNVVNLKIVERMARLLGCSFTTARDGAEALSRLDEERFDVILMDLQMPVMDGLEAMRRRRARTGTRAAVDSGDRGDGSRVCRGAGACTGRWIR